MMEMDSLARVTIPALVYRAMRCNADDVTAINNLFEAYFGGKGGLAAGDYIDDFGDLDASTTLGTLVLLSELWNFTPYDQLMDIINAAYFSIDLGAWMGEISDWGQWPTYPDDGHFGEWPQTAKPILMLNGTLDPQTTLAMAQPAGEHLTAAHQTFVTVPYSAHGVVFQSYTSASVDLLVANQDGYVMETCGMKLMYQFLDDPTAALDTSCLDDLNPLEYSADSPLNQWVSDILFGTTDMYEGVPAAGKRAPAVWPFRLPRRGPLGLR
jgi:hypothetical protein